MGRRLRITTLATLLTLYLSGAITWFLSHWFFSDHGFGPESSPWRFVSLQVHAILGLGFTAVFGYIFHAHIEPSWRRRRRIYSGLPLTAVCLFLILTMPCLYYLGDGAPKSAVQWLHTYIGLVSLGLFLAHWVRK